MSSGKVEHSPSRDTLKEPESGALPGAGNKLDAIRAQRDPSPTAAQEQPQSSWGEQQRLMALYLTGKLSAQQLAFKMRVHNSLAADRFLKDARRDATKAVDVREVPKTTAAPGNAQSKDEASVAPRNARDAKRMAKDTDDEHVKRKAEREEKQLAAAERQQTVNIINLFDRESRDLKSAHQWREMQREEQLADEARPVEGEAPNEAKLSRARHSQKPGLLGELVYFLQRLLRRKAEGQDGASGQDR